MERKFKLSICIPSYNRGNLAYNLVSSLLERIKQQPYVQVVLSNNGSTKNCEGYDKIKQIANSQLIYSENTTNLGYEGNFRKTLELSDADYCLFVSDEDDVITDSIDVYLDFLYNHPDVAVVYGKYKDHNNRVENEWKRTTEDNLILKKGTDAASIFYLEPCITGKLYNRNIVNDELVNQCSDKYSKLESYQVDPHVYWEMIAIQKGDFAFLYDFDLVSFTYQLSENLANEFAGKEGKKKKINRQELPEYWTNNIGGILSFILELDAEIDVKIKLAKILIPRGVKFIRRYSMLQKYLGNFSTDGRAIVSDYKKNLIEALENSVVSFNEKNYLEVLFEEQSNLAIQLLNKDSYTEAMLYLPSSESIKKWINDYSVNRLAICGAGGESLYLSIAFYERLCSVKDGIDVFIIDRGDPKYRYELVPDVYDSISKIPQYTYEEIPACDVIIVFALGSYNVIKKQMSDKTNAAVISIVELEERLFENKK